MKHSLATTLTGSYKKTAKNTQGNSAAPVTPDFIATQARAIRKAIVRMLSQAQSGHSAGALGMADVFATLYFGVLKHDPKNPRWEERDRVILSNGHICPVLYATLAQAGYFPKTLLSSLRKLNSPLQGHPHFLAQTHARSQHAQPQKTGKTKEIPHPPQLPGLENTSGPLAQGLSQAIGVATALKLDQKTAKVYCVMSDGELQEGQNWEALLYAGNKPLNNLIVLVDRNQIQIDGFTEHILPLEPLFEKLVAFGWNTYRVNAHSISSLLTTLAQAHQHRLGPSLILCNTTPGKGVSFMENSPAWHGKPPTPEQAEEALMELELKTKKRNT